LIRALWEVGDGLSLDPEMLVMMMIARGRVPVGRRGDEVIQRVVSHFDDPSRLMSGVNVAEFYTYRGWLDYGEAHLRKPPESPEFIRKICQRCNVFEAILNASVNLRDVIQIIS
jgi:hypothetical protein